MAYKTLDERVESAIDRETVVCYDVAAEHGQILDNVKRTQWFREALKQRLRTDSKRRKSNG